MLYLDDCYLSLGKEVLSHLTHSLQRSGGSRGRTPFLCFFPCQCAQGSFGLHTWAPLYCGQSQQRDARHQQTTEHLSPKNAPVRAPTVTWSSKLQTRSRYPKEASTSCFLWEEDTARWCYIAQVHEVPVGCGDQLWKSDEMGLARAPLPPSSALIQSLWAKPWRKPVERRQHREQILQFWLGFVRMNSPKPGPLSFLLTLPFRLTLHTPAFSILPNPFYPLLLPSCDCLSISLTFLPWLRHPSLCPASIWSSGTLPCHTAFAEEQHTSCTTALMLMWHLSSESLN